MAIENSHIYLLKHVIFDETIFPFTLSTIMSSPTTSGQISNESIISTIPPLGQTPSLHLLVMIAAPVAHSPGHHSPILDPSFEPLDSRSVTQLSSFIPLTRSHSMTTRSMNNIYKPKKLYLTTKYLISQPIQSSYVSQALKDHKW